MDIDRLDVTTLERFNGMVGVIVPDTIVPDNILAIEPEFAIDNLTGIMISYINDLTIIYPHLKGETQDIIRKELEKRLPTLNIYWNDFYNLIKD